MTDDASGELVREVRYLRDRLDILDCINGYGRGLDRLDVDLVRQAYHADAIDEHGPFVGGVDTFVPWAIEVEASFLVTHHEIGSHNCTVEGDTAYAESYVSFIVVHNDGKNLGTGYGRYIDQLERRDGRWAISIRRLVMDCGFEIARSGWLGEEWEKRPGLRNRQDISYQRPLSRPIGSN